jgi:hypothetical protein
MRVTACDFFEYDLITIDPTLIEWIQLIGWGERFLRWIKIEQAFIRVFANGVRLKI